MNEGVTMSRAGPDDVARLVELMTEFYAEAGFPPNPERAAAAFVPLIERSELGRVWLVRTDGASVGYVVLTLCYSMEYGGRSAYVDDLCIRAPYRARGLGRSALEHVRRACEALEIRAVHLEVDRNNPAAQALYRGFGFVETERQLLTLALASPAHAT